MLPKKIGIVIPSCGFDHIIETIPRMCHLSDPRIEIEIVTVINPMDRDKADDNYRKAHKASLSALVGREAPLTLQRLDFDEPIGFARAVNVGLATLDPSCDLLVVANDDLMVTRGWLTGMWFATKTKMINILNRVEMQRPPVPLNTLYRDGFKGIGIVGPCSDGASGHQRAGDKQGIAKYGLDEYARRFRMENAGVFVNTEYLSGYCMGVKPEVYAELTEDGQFFDERYPIGGYEDNDLCLRARRSGWGLVIACDTFVGHSMTQTLSVLAPDQWKGVRNFLPHLLKYEHETQAPQTAIGVMRVAFKCANDLAQFFSSVRRASLFLDGFAFTLTNDPTDVRQSYDRQLIPQLPEPCQSFLSKLMALKSDPDYQGAELEVINGKKKQILEAFVKEILDPRRDHPVEIKAEIWTGQFNERDERNSAIELAYTMGADWCLSIDADEVIEDRISPALFRKWLTHPNPDMNNAYVGWINHWETMNLVRIDRPYTNGIYRMSGPRLWKPDLTRIVSGTEQGLHCGNCPWVGRMTQFNLSLRFRHLSIVRGIDRINKTQFYNEIDKDLRPELVGGQDYSHIMKSEKVEVSIYNPANGIAGFCLMYDEENPLLFALNLDRYYGSMDRIAVVWTSEWAEEDREWSDFKNLEDPAWKNPELWREKYKTGPSWEVAQYSRLYKVEWLHKELTKEGGLAECRNCAVDFFRSTNNGSLSWIYFWDPDEQPHIQNEVGSALRGLAELNDTYGFMFKYANPTNTTKGTQTPVSERISMFRLEPKGRMRFAGRIHETLDESIKAMMRQGIHPNIKQTNCVFINMGLRTDPEKMRAKLAKYQGLLVEELENNPLSSASWLALGLQLLNDHDDHRARICLERVSLCWLSIPPVQRAGSDQFANLDRPTDRSSKASL